MFEHLVVGVASKVVVVRLHLPCLVISARKIPYMLELSFESSQSICISDAHIQVPYETPSLSISRNPDQWHAIHAHEAPCPPSV